MNALKQILAVTSMNLRSVARRLGASSVIVIGIAGVVGVLVSILAMVAGLSQMMKSTGHTDRAIVMAAGASFEFVSNLSREAAQTIADAQGIRRGVDGKPIASAEALVVIRMPLRQSGNNGNLPLRGVSQAVFALRPEIHLIEGRIFKPAVRELIVGRTARHQFPGLDVGSRVSIRGSDWTVVGVFESGGDEHEAGMITDAYTLQSAFQRNSFQSVAVLLDSAQSFTDFKASLARNPSLAVDVMRESDYYARQTQEFTQVLSIVAYLVGGIMAIGAMFGALNAMYSAVGSRTVEIATLRVLGFEAGAVIASVFAEALMLAVLGGLVGGGVAWLLFNGNVVSTNGGGVTQLAVPLAVDGHLVAVGVAWACIIGMLGASFPAIRAVRIPLASALRGT
jgi:putative ABC transport system permease protein